MSVPLAEQIYALSGFDADLGTVLGDEDTITGQDFRDHAAQWMTDGAREVINIISKTPKYLDLLTRSNTLDDNSTTLSLSNSKIGNVVLFDGTSVQQCRRISSSMRGRVDDINDLMNYATTTDPVYWIKSGVLEIAPTPTDSNYAYVETITYPAFTAGDSGSYDIVTQTSISNFPDEAQYLVILYAAIKAVEYMMLSEEDQEVYAPQLQALSTDYQQALGNIKEGAS
tara:strand:+ start:433 stop:1113 length:681 start_codon:yes stop_codon:yes gene_type:complete